MTTLTRDEYTTLAFAHDGVRSSYGGRGMYGDTCLAYTGSEPLLFIFDLAEVLVLRDNDDPAVDDIRYELDRLGMGRTDSMGRGTVHYWPSITVEPGDDDEDDEDDDDDDW